MQEPSGLEQRLIAECQRVGFARAGIARATDADGFASYREWLDHGYAGEMGYLHKHAEARQHPRGVYADVRSVVMVAMSYSPDLPPPQTPFPARIARYALGGDYHHVLRERLKLVAAWLRQQCPDSWGRVVVDTAPLLERDFARRAGLGWIGKNTMLIHPRLGSYFVLAALLVNVDLTPTPSFDTRHCGTCTACLDACPTDAFVAPGRLDARKCISYLTIELKHDVPAEWRGAIGDWLFGCDVCQEVCPWNRKAPASSDALAPRADLLVVDAVELLGLSREAFRARFEGTALYPRPGRPVVLRNAALVLGNQGDAAALPALEGALKDEEPLIREAAAWAIARIGSRSRA